MIPIKSPGYHSIETLTAAEESPNRPQHLRYEPLDRFQTNQYSVCQVKVDRQDKLQLEPSPSSVNDFR